MTPSRSHFAALWVFVLFESFLSSSVMAQEVWAPTGGPSGGQIYSLTRTAEGILYAGTIGGIYRSADNGSHWEIAGVGAPPTWPACLTAHPDGTVFATYYGYGVFRTTNGGRSWLPVNSGLGDWGPPALALDAYVLAIGQAGEILCGTNRGIIRSTDNGDNWDFSSPHIVAHSLVFDSSGHVFAGTWESTLFTSTDDGKNWTPNASAPGVGLFYTLTVSPGGSLFLGTDIGIFRSSDAGRNWQPRNSGLIGRIIGAIVFDGQGNAFAGTSGGVHRSTNNGDTWTPVGTSAQAIGGNGLVVGEGSNLVVGTFDGTYRSTNSGSAWTLATDGISSSVLMALALERDGSLIGCTNGGHFVRSTDSGTLWSNAGEIGAPVSSLATLTNGIVVGGGFRGMYRSTDSGTSWLRSSQGLADTNVTGVVIDANENVFAGTTGGGVFRSIDGGRTWSPANNGLGSHDVSNLAIHPDGGLFAATAAGIYKSSDRGNTWTACGALNGGAATASLVAIAGSGEMYAYAGNQFFDSKDNGASWQDAGFSTGFIGFLLADSGNDFVGCGPTGVIRGTESGACLRWINDGLTQIGTNRVVIAPDGHLVAGTNGGGVYRTHYPIQMGTGNILRNSQFAAGTDQWAFFTNGQASFVAASPVWERNSDCHAACVTILAPGTGEYLTQSDITLHAGRRYRLSFRALCTTGHDLEVDLMKQSLPYSTYGFVGERRDLEPFWQIYSVEFTASRFSGTTNDAMLRFRFNGNDAQGDAYFLDDIYLEELPESGPPRILAQPADDIERVGSSATFVLEAAGTAPLTYQWYKNGTAINGATSPTYTTPPAILHDDSSAFHCQVTNPAGVAISNIAVLRVTNGGTSLLVNGDFESGSDHWMFFADVAGGSTFDTDVAGPRSARAAHIAVSTPGDNIQLYQHSIRLKKDKRYRLSFKAYSNNGHDMELWLHQHADPFTLYGLKGLPIDLDTYWKTFIIEFQATNIIDSVDDARLRFWFVPYAESGDHYFVDEVLLEEYVPPEPATSVNGAIPLPSEFTLGQSYPNPANPGATIQYALPAAAHVRLAVYTLLGQEVAVLVNGPQEPGYHSVRFDGSGRASGVYLYRISADRFVATKKLMLIK